MLSPIILGDNMLPSICCIIKRSTVTHNAFDGDISNAIRIGGTAPIIGPKYGIIFAMPFITDNIIGKSTFNDIRTMKVSPPMSILSKN